MIDDQHYYSGEDLVTLDWLKANHPEQIADGWKQNEFSSLEEMLRSVKDGYLRSLPARTGQSINYQVKQNFYPENSKPDWLKHVNQYPELMLVQVNKALILPSDDLVYHGKRILISEARDSSGRLIEASMARPGELTVGMDRVRSLFAEAGNKTGTYLYAGKFWNHYGHFLMEALSGLWPFTAYPLGRYGIHPVYSVLSKDRPGRNQFVAESFKSLGLDINRMLFAREPVIIERLLIPVRSSRIHSAKHDYIHPVQQKVWSAINPARYCKRPKRKVYLSRKLFQVRKQKKRPLMDEEQVERLFRSYGFDIIYPEQCSFKQQLKIMQRAKMIAGPTGSNLLNAAFANEGANLVVLRPVSLKDRTLLLLSDVKKFNILFFFSEDDHIQHNSAESWSVNLEELESFLLNHEVFKPKISWGRRITNILGLTEP